MDNKKFANRGYELLKLKVEDYKKKNKSNNMLDILDLFLVHFEDRVDVMHYDGHYAAQTLFLSFVDALEVIDRYPENDGEKEILYQLVDAIYIKKREDGNVVHTHAPLTTEEKNSPEYKQHMLTNLSLIREIDNQEQQEMGAEYDINHKGQEVINLIYDWKMRQDANIEGMRTLGYLPADFNEEEDELPSDIRVDAPKFAVKVTPEDEFDFGVRCPDCLGKYFYKTAFDTYSCYDCDNSFVLDSRLEDFIDYTQAEDEETGLLVDEDGNPLMTPKKRALSETENTIKVRYPDARFKLLETKIKEQKIILKNGEYLVD